MYHAKQIGDKSYCCPSCGDSIRRTLKPQDTYRCSACEAKFSVLIDTETGRAAFFAPPEEHPVRPLNLPMGSVRALVTLSLTAIICGLLVIGQDIPRSSMNLLLTMVGFYLGLRSKKGSTRDKVFEGTVYPRPPLFLPPGYIRLALFLAIGLTALTLYSRGLLFTKDYLEFFGILAGLLLGHLTNRGILRNLESHQTQRVVGHLTASVVLLATATLCGLLLTGHWQNCSETIMLLPTLIVSFYFGSRS